MLGREVTASFYETLKSLQEGLHHPGPYFLFRWERGLRRSTARWADDLVCTPEVGTEVTQVLPGKTLQSPPYTASEVPLKGPSAAAAMQEAQREPRASPNRIFCPACSLKLKSLGASKMSTMVEPKLNSPRCSPLRMGMPSLLACVTKLKSL